MNAYNASNDLFLPLVTRQARRPARPRPREDADVLHACYNLDKFGVRHRQPPDPLIDLDPPAWS